VRASGEWGAILVTGSAMISEMRGRARRSAGLLLFALIGAACGRVGYDYLAAVEADAGVAVDADPAGLLFGEAAPAFVTFGDISIEDPSFTADLLELYFIANQPGGSEIWRSTRAAPSGPWGVPAPVSELNGAGIQEHPGIEPDGLTLWFASDRPGGLGSTDIWKSTRASRADPWDEPVHVPELSSSSADSGITVARGGLLVILASNRAGAAGSRSFWTASRSSVSEPFGELRPVSEINSSRFDGDPWLSEDGLRVVFATQRDGGQRMLYTAVREDVDQQFEMRTSIRELNTSDREADPWLSPDLRYIMFSSNRSGIDLIYEASR
jgi:hypothetical protein